MTNRAHARRIAVGLSRSLAKVLDEEADRIRRRLTKIEQVKRGDVRLRPVPVKAHHVDAYDVREHTRWIAVTPNSKSRS